MQRLREWGKVVFLQLNPSCSSAPAPLESGFYLNDGKLKLSETTEHRIPHADLAFLSACQTSTGDEKKLFLWPLGCLPQDIVLLSPPCGPLTNLMGHMSHENSIGISSSTMTCYWVRQVCGSMSPCRLCPPQCHPMVGDTEMGFFI